MGKILSQTQIDQYHEQGFVSPIDLLSEDEAASYLHRLELAEQDYPEHLNSTNRNNPHLAFRFLDELVHHPVLVDVVEDLLGADFSLWGSVLFIKEPQTQHFVSWHQDATYMGIEPKTFLTPWIALTHSNLTNGCMTMLPGSHHNGIQAHDDTYGKDNILTRGQNIPDPDLSSATNLILRPGQMSIHHACTIHGSQPNRSQTRRVGYALQSYVPSGARQTLGECYWLPIRGDSDNPDMKKLARPKNDMDSDAVEQRERVNRNLADILYQGAEKVRDY